MDHRDLENAVRKRQEALSLVRAYSYSNVASFHDKEQTVLNEIARRDADIALEVATKLVEYTVAQLVEQGFKAELELLTATSTKESTT